MGLVNLIVDEQTLPLRLVIARHPREGVGIAPVLTETQIVKMGNLLVGDLTNDQIREYGAARSRDLAKILMPPKRRYAKILVIIRPRIDFFQMFRIRYELLAQPFGWNASVIAGEDEPPVHGFVGLDVHPARLCHRRVVGAEGAEAVAATLDGLLHRPYFLHAAELRQLFKTRVLIIAERVRGCTDPCSS